MYYAIFYSNLIYGCNVWGLTSIENIHKIETIQRKCVRILTFAPYNSHTNQAFIDLGLLKVKEVIKLQQLKLVYDFHNNQLPDDLMGLFKLVSEVHSTNQLLRSAANTLIYIPAIKTKSYGHQSIRFHCAKLWNDIFKTGSIRVDADRKNDIA